MLEPIVFSILATTASRENAAATSATLPVASVNPISFGIWGGGELECECGSVRLFTFHYN